MNKQVFKAHPIMLFRLIKPFLFILLIPLLRAIIQYITKGEINGLLALEVICVLSITVFTVLRWLAISIEIKNESIIVKKGFILKSIAVIEKSRISSVVLKQNIFDYIFRSVDCSINTEAGTPRKSDYSFKLRVNDAKILYKDVYNEENSETVKFSAFRIALLAATTSSAVTGMIIGVPVLNQASDLLGIAISEMLLNEINHVSSRFNNIFPPIVNTVTIILLIAYFVAFVISFIKNINFKLQSGKETVEVQSGFIAKKRIMFKKSKINDICFEQTPLMRLVKKYSMIASVGGYGDNKGEKAVVVPVASHVELEKHFKRHFKHFKPHGKPISPEISVVNLYRFLYIPAIIAFLILGLAATLVFAFPYFDRLVIFLTAIALCIDGYYSSVCYNNYKLGKLCLSDSILVSGSSGFNVRKLYCDKSRIGVVKISQTPADRHFNTCKVKITVRSESADSAKVRNLDLDTVKTIVKKQFNINYDV